MLPLSVMLPSFSVCASRRYTSTVPASALPESSMCDFPVSSPSIR